MQEKQIFKIIWQGIQISIAFIPDYSEGFKKFIGVAQSHIEVHANERLPFTHTGYRSLFLTYPEVEQRGGAVHLVQTWLDQAAQSKAWKAYAKAKGQLSLF